MIKERVENRTTVVLNATPLHHVSMTRKNGLIGLAFLCVTIPIMLVAQPAEKKTLVGVWEVKISAGGGPPQPLLSIASFGGDGSFTTTGNTKFPQGLGSDERGPGYGRWAQTGDREFKLTFYAVHIAISCPARKHGYRTGTWLSGPCSFLTTSLPFFTALDGLRRQ
jgi:hypothetical protein